VFLRLLTAVTFAIDAHVLTVSARVQDRATATTSHSPGAQEAMPRSPRVASYSIDARLDPSARTISADEVITWRNTTANPAATLQFHLYYNAWQQEDVHDFAWTTSPDYLVLTETFPQSLISLQDHLMTYGVFV
jgi:hypothetical protein